MKVLFMGTPSFAVPSLRALLASGHQVLAVVTQPDRPSGRGLIVKSSPVKALAVEKEVRLLQPERIRTEPFLDEIRAIGPEILVVVAYGRILPPALLRAAPHGGVNVHASLLPKYRGAAPVEWAIARGETVTGVTTMRMVEELDAGEILMQRSTPILENDTGGTLERRLSEIGATLLIETLDAIEEGSMALLPQRSEEATFAPILSKEDGRLDWTCGALEIERRIRAFDPRPGAFTSARGRMLRLWRARVEASPGGAESAATPGAVLRAGSAGVVVACGGGSLLGLLEIQPEGKRRMSAAEAAAGRYLAVGDRLGG